MMTTKRFACVRKVWVILAEICGGKGIRIVGTLEYNAPNGELFPNIAVRTDVESIYTHLTQPTGLGGGLGWYPLYQPFIAPWWESIGAFLFG